jgi:prevent-host-death family protein
MNTYVIPARDLQKSYKAIIETVRTNKKPVVLTTNKKPQAAIVSLEDLALLQARKAHQASLRMLELVVENIEELKSLPHDLRERTNEILYSKDND